MHNEAYCRPLEDNSGWGVFKGSLEDKEVCMSQHTLQEVVESGDKINLPTFSESKLGPITHQEAILCGFPDPYSVVNNPDSPVNQLLRLRRHKILEG
jgi:hypothetical protein